MDRNFSVAINPSPSKGEITVLFSGRSDPSPEHCVGPKVHDYFLVHYVLSGKGSFQCMGKDYKLAAGSWFFIFPGELVSYVSDSAEPWTYRWIGFRGERADELLASLGITAHRPVVCSGRNRKVQALFSQTEKVLKDGRPGCDLHAGGLFRLLLAEAAKALGQDPAAGPSEPLPESRRQVEQAIRWLTLQYSQPVSIEHMAQTLGYHRTHLAKIFKQQTGVSPTHFLLKIRMEQAKALLSEPLSVEQVASSVGFADPLYFSKQFKKWYGLSPSEYRTKKLGKDRFDCSSNSHS